VWKGKSGECFKQRKVTMFVKEPLAACTDEGMRRGWQRRGRAASGDCWAPHLFKDNIHRTPNGLNGCGDAAGRGGRNFWLEPLHGQGQPLYVTRKMGKEPVWAGRPNLLCWSGVRCHVALLNRRPGMETGTGRKEGCTYRLRTLMHQD
jgi:hypothetical protein